MQVKKNGSFFIFRLINTCFPIKGPTFVSYNIKTINGLRKNINPQVKRKDNNKLLREKKADN